VAVSRQYWADQPQACGKARTVRRQLPLNPLATFAPGERRRLRRPPPGDLVRSAGAGLPASPLETE
jgi:hypothetical protein